MWRDLHPERIEEPGLRLHRSHTPEIREADHLFVNIERLRDFLTEWTQRGGHLQPEVSNYLAGHFLHEPLRDWDVSRPAPYFGFEIPDSPGNYWYVWFDAPIGYMASTRQWCDRHGENFDDWWRSDKTEIHHFIGKDITYFHTLFWPVMLKTAKISLPKKVHIHGFLTVAGEKMSKSKGTFVRAATYLEHLNPAYLRYYYASKLTARVDDLDLNLDEFVSKINSDLVGKGGQSGQPHGEIRRENRPVESPIPTMVACSSKPPPTAGRLPRRMKNATSTAPCGRSWPWPIGRTNTSNTPSPGRSTRIRKTPSSCRTFAPSG